MLPIQPIAKEDARIGKLRTECAKIAKVLQPMSIEIGALINHAHYKSVPAPLKKNFNALSAQINSMKAKAEEVISRRTVDALSFSMSEVTAATKDANEIISTMNNLLRTLEGVAN